jgi:hypothetical protein
MPLAILGQSQGGSAKSILALSESDQIAFAEATFEQGFPEDRADQLTMLVVNRSHVVVPILVARLETVLNSTDKPQLLADTAIEVISYAGDVVAIRAVGRLLPLDEQRFGPYVGRVLTNAANWRNPFALVYQTLEIPDSRVAPFAMRWCEESLASTRRQRQWAEAMLDKYGRVPAESDWASDPIASRLNSTGTAFLRERVLAAAAEAQRIRQQRQ